MAAGLQQYFSIVQKIFASFGARLYAIIAIAVICFLAVSSYQVLRLKQALEAGHALDLKHVTEVAAGILREEYAASEAGRISAAEAKKRAASRISKLRYGKDGYFWINDLGGRMIMHPMKPELDGKIVIDQKDPDGVPLFREFIRTVKESGSGYVRYSWPKPGAKEPQPKISFVTGFAPWGWIIGSGLYIDGLQRELWDEVKSGLLVVSVILLAIGGGALMFVRGVSHRLTALTSVIAEVAKGNLDVPPADTDGTTELGAIASAIEDLRRNAIEQRTLQEKVNDAHARERERERHLEACVQQFEQHITAVVQALGEQVDQLTAAAVTLSEAAETSTLEAGNAASVSQSAADNSHSVSSATGQLSSSIKEIASQAQSTNTVVQAASLEAEQTNADVAGLANAAEEIGSIVAVIRGIADQTNLLALNATIEAARAGETGRGFAVVAAEVKELSAQTATATDAIAEQIHAIQSSTGTAVSAIKSVSGKVAEIQAFTGAIAAAVEEQTAAAEAIASNVALAANASEKASASSSEVSKTAAQTKQQAWSVSEVSHRLSEISSQISWSINNFKDTLAQKAAS